MTCNGQPVLLVAQEGEPMTSDEAAFLEGAANRDLSNDQRELNRRRARQTATPGSLSGRTPNLPVISDAVRYAAHRAATDSAMEDRQEITEERYIEELERIHENVREQNTQPLEIDPIRSRIEFLFTETRHAVARQIRSQWEGLERTGSTRTERSRARDAIRRLELHILSGQEYATFMPAVPNAPLPPQGLPQEGEAIRHAGPQEGNGIYAVTAVGQQWVSDTVAEQGTNVVPPTPIRLLTAEERAEIEQIYRDLNANSGETGAAIGAPPAALPEPLTVGSVPVVARATPELDSALSNHGFW